MNGKPVPHRATIAVPFLEVPHGHEKAVLHGYESGDWRGVISLPKSEMKHPPSVFPAGITYTTPVEFGDYFIVTNWIQRTPATTATK